MGEHGTGVKQTEAAAHGFCRDFNALFGGAIVGLAGGTGDAGVGPPILAVMVLAAALVWMLLAGSGRVTGPEAVLLPAVYGAGIPGLA